MKKSFLGAGLMLFGFSLLAQAQSPQDSVILESKTVCPQAGASGSGIVRLKVYITNAESLTYFTLCVKESTMAGGAYMTLSSPRTFSGIVTNLTNSFHYSPIASATSQFYNSSSPDRFLLGAGFDPFDPSTIEPPNAVRKPVWEIKFDTVWNNIGTIVFDSAIVSNALVTLTTTQPIDIHPIFLKSVVTVVAQAKGDLNLDGVVSPADVVLELMGVFMGSAPPAGLGNCDLNCDGQVSPADVTVMLIYKFVSLTWPC